MDLKINFRIICLFLVIFQLGIKYTESYRATNKEKKVESRLHEKVLTRFLLLLEHKLKKNPPSETDYKVLAYIMHEINQKIVENKSDPPEFWYLRLGR